MHNWRISLLITKYKAIFSFLQICVAMPDKGGLTQLQVRENMYFEKPSLFYGNFKNAFFTIFIFYGTSCKIRNFKSFDVIATEAFEVSVYCCDIYTVNMLV